MKYLKLLGSALRSPAWLLWFGGYLSHDFLQQIIDYPHSPRSWLQWLNLLVTLIAAISFTRDGRRKLREDRA